MGLVFLVFFFFTFEFSYWCSPDEVTALTWIDLITYERNVEIAFQNQTDKCTLFKQILDGFTKDKYASLISNLRSRISIIPISYCQAVLRLQRTIFYCTNLINL
jgi:hypothetical protein